MLIRLRKYLYYIAYCYALCAMLSTPSLAQTSNNEPKMHVDRNKIIFGGPVNERIIQHKFYNENPSCGDEELNIKVSKGRVNYNMNDGKNTRIQWRKDGSEIIVGNDGCKIRVIINRPPVSTKCEQDRCG